MPELPEVETIKVGLSKMLPGHQVKSVKSNWKKSFPNSKNDVSKFLIGSKIVQVRRRAKVLIIDLDSKYSLVIHLKMTGQLVFVQKQESPVVSRQSPATKDKRLRTKDEVRFGAGHPTDSLIGKLPDKSTRIIFDMGEAELFFNDQRKFGWARLIPTIEIENIDFFKKLGPEPLEDDFTAKDFKERIKKRLKSYIKPVLLDQTVIAGVGNIYADESLWCAKIHPLTRVKDLQDLQLDKLYKCLRDVLELSIKKGGSTDKNYIDAEGKRGSYLKFAKVFRRENLPCPRCASNIIKTRVAGRGTHICPACQIIA
ncbi:MAG TPA: bifunctional DNA-formamidopyrimidine glycosylase/DNA-(apurinic or apyrimidinic site) lyase [Candidatus Saccharimonadales bacterium]|nr:bifunctional DNA-formamidopyrimidine glycosylase/DNA-(apurinic or apyrimidinic site) lyase [Candidatus Saccharimonadales bacterium]